MTDAFDLTGRVAVVTGGSRGLGAAMASAFAEHGADVVIASRKLDACQELAGHLAKRTGRRAVGAAFHAGRWADADRLADLVYEEFGRCDVLVNNAGMSPLYPSLSEISEDLFDKVVAVNFKGPFRLSALVGERMVAAGCGSIINVSSLAAVGPSRVYPVYSGAADAMVQWWYGHNAVAFFLTAGFLGMMYYFVPRQAQQPLWSYRFSIVNFWALISIYMWAGPHHLIYTALPDWVQSLGMAFSRHLARAAA